MLTIEVVTAPLFSMCYFSSELQQTEAVNAILCLVVLRNMSTVQN